MPNDHVGPVSPREPDHAKTEIDIIRFASLLRVATMTEQPDCGYFLLRRVSAGPQNCFAARAIAGLHP
jgi:hypothetical protein